MKGGEGCSNPAVTQCSSLLLLPTFADVRGLAIPAAIHTHLKANKVAGYMCSYNRVNGVYACENAGRKPRP